MDEESDQRNSGEDEFDFGICQSSGFGDAKVEAVNFQLEGVSNGEACVQTSTPG